MGDGAGVGVVGVRDDFPITNPIPVKIAMRVSATPRVNSRSDLMSGMGVCGGA